MNTNEVIGTVIALGLPLLVSIIAIIRPIINLNTSITELNVTIKQLTKDNDDIHDTLANFSTELADHETRITLLERK